LVRIASNGRYIAAPTYQGGVFFFDIKTGNVTGMLNDHEELEVRDVIFHPTKKVLFTCSDGKYLLYSVQFIAKFFIRWSSQCLSTRLKFCT
jgi:WD40 repeat protein